MSDNPFNKTNSVRNAIKKLALRIRNLERRVAALGSGQRTSFGQMYNDGTQINGAGSGDWSAAQGIPDITITFDPPFTDPPAVVAIANDSTSGVGPNPNGCAVVQVSVAVDNVVLRVVDNSGAAVGDVGINFQATGVSA